MNGNLREMQKFAEERGWTSQQRRNKGFKFIHPNGIRAVTTSGRNSTSELLRFKAEIRRVETLSGIRHSTEHMVKVQSDGNPFAALAPLKEVLEHPDADNLIDDDGDDEAAPVQLQGPRKRGYIRNMDAFPYTDEPRADGGKRRVYHANCCMCPEHATVRTRKGRTESPAKQTASLLRARGWVLAKSRSDDLCASCANVMDGRAPPKICNQDEAPPAPMMQSATMPAPAVAIPTARMSITERVTQINIEAHRTREEHEEEVLAAQRQHLALWRRVHRAIDKAYIDADTGYAAGESDEKIAKKFGVAIEEVAKRREEYFGPELVDSAKRDVIRDLHALKQDLNFFQKNVIEAAASLEGRISTLLAKLKVAPEVTRQITGEVPPRTNGHAHPTVN